MDWIDFKEFEDVDERAPSYFDLQANGEHNAETVPEVVYSVACGASESEQCAVCGEQFQVFWAEQEEEWHLRNAVRHNDQAYHPACYEDFEKIYNSTSIISNSSFDEKKMDMDTQIGELDEDPASPVKVKEEKCEDKEERMSEIDDKVGMIQEDIRKEGENIEVNEKERQEKEDSTNKDEDIKVEMKEPDVAIKVEPMDMDEGEIKNSFENMKSESNVVESEENKTEDIKPIIKTESILPKSENANVESISASQNENVPTKSEDELEFRPPTPDPRFQILPPVSRGTEISNLCTIM